MLLFHPWDNGGDHEDEEKQLEGILGGVPVGQLVEGAVHYVHIHQVLTEYKMYVGTVPMVPVRILYAGAAPAEPASLTPPNI